MKRFLPLALILVSICGLICCNSKPKRVVTADDIRRFEERNIEVNKEIVKLKQDTIKQFIEDHQLTMTKTGSGLWYNLKPSGDTTSIHSGDMVQIAYNVRLLNGKLCYSSDSSGLKKFKVGQGGVESGLEEMLLLMHKGDTAEMLIPPHLAHGLMGDQKKIPTLAILHYFVIVKDCQQANQ